MKCIKMPFGMHYITYIFGNKHGNTEENFIYGVKEEECVQRSEENNAFVWLIYDAQKYAIYAILKTPILHENLYAVRLVLGQSDSIFIDKFGKNIRFFCRSPPSEIHEINELTDFEITGGKNMDEYNYTGNKTKNYFTAYLQKFVWRKRLRYLREKKRICDMEKPFEENEQAVFGMTIDEMLEINHREYLLFKEMKGIYPKENELSDQRLIRFLMLLREDERRFIYQHVFEEKTFKEIGYLNDLKEDKVKSIYYYAIHKIRKWMGGDR